MPLTAILLPMLAAGAIVYVTGTVITFLMCAEWTLPPERAVRVVLLWPWELFVWLCLWSRE